MSSRNTFSAEKPYNALPLLPPRAELETKPVLKALVGARTALAELKTMANGITTVSTTS